jgi:hypothetical protein
MMGTTHFAVNATVGIPLSSRPEWASERVEPGPMPPG